MRYESVHSLALARIAFNFGLHLKKYNIQTGWKI
jgi:hypothetical protein